MLRKGQLMALRDLPLKDLLDIAELNIRTMRSEENVDKLSGLVSLKTIVSEMQDRVRNGSLAIEPLPYDSLADVIAKAMWDDNDNRIGGPRVAAEAVKEYLKLDQETEKSKND
jgi:hypothetical protein